MFLLAPLVLVGPLLLLVEAVLTLGGHGPVGWLAGAGLVLGVLWAGRWCWRCTRRWWASTRAPVRPPGARPHRGPPARR